MFQTDDLAIDHFKDVPGFKGLLKAVLKHQIQVLVEQLHKHADEETIVLSASLSDGGLSYLGSVAAKDFLEEKDEIKVQFLKHCLTKRHMQEKEASAVDSYKETFTSSQYDQTSCHYSINPDTFHRTQQPRNKARKLSHPQHIKPTRQIHDSYPLEQGIDLSNHTMRKHRQPSVEIKPPTVERDHMTSHNHTRTHSSPPITIIKTEPSESDVSKLELSSESDTELKVTKVEPSVSSVDMAEDLTRVHVNNIKDTGQQNFSNSVFQQGIKMDSDRHNAQLVDNLEALSQAADQSQQTAGILDSSQLIPWGNQSLNEAFGYQPPPHKKRVYRKVECEICHKLIYITNIKVHKLRHMKNSIGFHID